MSIKPNLKIVGAALALCSISSYAATPAVTIPVTFTSGTPANAADVNSDFTALANAVNSLATTVATLQASSSGCGGRCLVVRDANGLLMGPVISTYPLTNAPSGVVITTTAGPTIFTLVTSGYASNGVPQLIFSDTQGNYSNATYYTTTNCTGTPYAHPLMVGLIDPVSVALLTARMVGATYYIWPAGAGQSITVNSFLSFGQCQLENNSVSLVALANGAAVSSLGFTAPYTISVN